MQKVIEMVAQEISTDQGSELAEEHDYIEKFSQKMIREKCGNYPYLKRSIDGKIIYPDTNGITSNRGNKLLQKSELVSRDNINNTKPIDEECIFYNGSEHNLLQRKRMRFNPLPGQQGAGEQEEENADDDFDLNKLVDVTKILSPISSLNDITTNASISTVYKSKILRDLALQAVLMVEREQDAVNGYTKLLEVLLGNLVDPLHECNLNIKDYDHKLIIEESDNENDNDNEQDPENTSGNNTTINDDDTLTKYDGDEEVGTGTSKSDLRNEDIDLKKNTDNLSNDLSGLDNINDGIANNDPFFAIPNVDVLTRFDTNDNSKSEESQNSDMTSSYSLSNLTKEFPNHEKDLTKINDELETSRQLTQIALQRNQEFIRNLSKIRNYLIKAQRIKERIYSWSKEVSGIQEEGILIPSLLKDVKRGLIRITTNKSMAGEGEENQDQDEENEED